MSKKIIRILSPIIIIAAVLTSIGWVLSNNKKKNEEKTAVAAQKLSEVAVKTAEVVKKPVNINFSANGNFIPYQQLNFSAETSGRVVNVLVREGDRVRKGQILAAVKTDGLNIDLQSAEENYQNALQDKVRFENAFSTGGVTQQQLDQAILALKNAAFRVEQARIRIGDATIKASISGIVNKRFIEPGAVLNPGAPLFELVDVSKLKLNVKVNEMQVAQIKTGDKVKVKASVFPDKEFTGTIRFIAPKADEALNFPVEIEMANNAAQQVKAGMFATAIFEFPEPPASLVIPRTAFMGSVSNNEVFVVGEGGVSHLVKVTPGRIVGDEVEILQGLTEGDTVIISGQANLFEGSKINVLQ